MTHTRTLPTTMRTALAVVTILGLLASATAAPVTHATVRQDPAPEDEIVRLEAWPTPEDAKAIRKDVDRLRKARTEEMTDEARSALASAGAAAAPTLLKALSKERDEAARDRLTEALERATGAPHTRLLARELDNKSPTVRAFALHRIAAFPDPGCREPAEAALTKARERGTKSAPDETYYAALCVTSTGSLDGLDELRTAARESWPDRGPEMRTALAGVRGVEATDALLPALDGDRTERLVALRLLAGCGDESAVGRIVTLLDVEDNSVRIASINALRGIVDDDPPLDRLPVFEAIDRARQWKERAR